MKKTIMHHFIPILILIAVSAGLHLLWRLNSPYPYTLNWDIWEHQTAVNAIRNGTFALFPSALSDTFQFDGYTTLFHFVVATIQTLTNTQNILGFWWIAEAIFFVGTSVAMYSFVHSLTKNRWASVIAGILSAGFFESSMAYTTLFLLPQTLASLIWVLGMAIITANKTHRLQLALFFSLIIITLHGIVGSLGAVLLLIYALEPKMKNLYTFIAFGLGYAIPTLITQFFPVTTINSGEALHFTQTISQKLILFQQWYGFLPLPFLAIGIWKGQKNLVVLFAATTGIILSAFPYVLKFTVFTHYLMIAIMAFGIAWCIDQIHSTVMKGISVLIITAASIAIFVANAYAWQKPVLFHGIASQVSGNEMETAETLQTKYPNKNMILVSDPATQYIMEALTEINSQGGAYMNEKTRTYLVEAFTATGTTQFNQQLSNIHDALPSEKSNTKLLVISGRTFKWLAAPEEKRNSITYNIWRPEALSLENNITIETWKQQFQLTEVYRNASVVVLAEKSYDTK